MPIVPVISRTKSVATGSPYSPATSFNPDKKLFFDTHVTTLGVLAGPPITSDGVDVTVPIGTQFIQNGIIVTLTTPFTVPIPVMAFPKYLMASVDSEVPGSNVTIEFQASATAPLVLLATLNPNNTTVVLPTQVSIRALRQDIDAIGAASPVLDAYQDATLVKANIDELSVEGPNVTMSDVGGTRAQVGVTLDVKDDAVTQTVKTNSINFTGKGVAVSPASANSATVNIQGVEGFLEGGIIDGLVDGSGGAREFTITGLVVNRDGVRSGPITTTVPVTANASGFPRTDMLQWDGSTLTVKAGTPGATAPCPTPDPGNIPISVALVPNSAPALLRSMNMQAGTSEAVIVAYYYSNGGLHASRVGVTSSPTIGTTTYKDAEEMMLSVFFPRSGYRYELAWDTVIAQSLYGFLNEGATINMSYDGADESDTVQSRGYMHNNLLGGVSIHGFEVTVAMFYNRGIVLGPHTLKGRIKQGTISTPEVMHQMRRRIWIHEIQ